MNLEGKVAIVTGSGGKGTGRAGARRFAREGIAVVVSDANDVGGHETVALIAADAGRAAFHHADVKNENEINALIAFAESSFGGLDILVNNVSSPDAMGLLTGWMAAVHFAGRSGLSNVGLTANPSAVLSGIPSNQNAPSRPVPAMFCRFCS